MKLERSSMFVSLLLALILSGTGSAGPANESPIVESREVVSGPSAEVEILIDRWGVPHIYASTREDAFFAQGWNAARDRLWQIDLWRRSGLGELAEALGSAYVAQDRATRLFIYRGDMQREWRAYGADAKRNTEAFVAGINAYVAATRSNPSLLPMEFKRAGYEPSFWKADDVVRVRNHGVAGTVLLQVQRAQIACRTGDVMSSDLLYKISPRWAPVTAPGLDPCSIPANVLDVYQLAQKLLLPKAEQFAPRAAEGSNGWVVTPERSATGRPILANDPHRGLVVPSLRYIAHLVAPGLNVIGAGEPALPGIAIGHNERIAFGMTVFSIAQEDLYVYETNPRNPQEYRYGDGWEAMRVVHEQIAVRDGGAERAELKFTRHGPVVLEDPARHRAYAVRAAWLDTGGAPYFGSMRYLRAKNRRQFAAALEHWGVPGENQIYADTSGRTGWFPAGLTPVRPNTDGLLPVPGDGRYEWRGYLPRQRLPSQIDFARGYFVTANQMNLPDEYPFAERRVGFSWPDATRFERIEGVLSGLATISLDDSRALQSDVLNFQALRLIKVLQNADTVDARLQNTIHWLSEWDGRVTVDSSQAALYELWSARHLPAQLIARVLPALPESYRTFGVLGVPRPVIELIESPDERFGVQPKMTRDAVLLESLAGALTDIEQRFGKDRSKWRWGYLSSIRFAHPLSAAVDETSRHQMSIGPEPMAGDGATVGLAAYDTQEFRTQYGAAFRMVLDVGRWDESVAINAPGQSGNPASPHYRDLFPLWLGGRHFPLLYSRLAVERAAQRRIVLQPKHD